MASGGSGPDALYQLQGQHILPSELTQGPWDPTAQHGGAVAALAVRCLERIARPVPMRLARFSLDLLRPVPVAPLRAEPRIARSGKRLQLAELRLLHAGEPVAQASGLFIRVERLCGLEAVVSGSAAPSAAFEAAAPLPEDREHPGYIRALELRTSGTRQPGGWSGPVWCRLRVSVVAGEKPSACERLAAAADLGSGMASGLDFDRYVAINPDLHVQVERTPDSDWIGVEAETHIARDGMGHSLGSVFDQHGRVACLQASLYVDRRDVED